MRNKYSFSPMASCITSTSSLPVSLSPFPSPPLSSSLPLSLSHSLFHPSLPQGSVVGVSPSHVIHSYDITCCGVTFNPSGRSLAAGDLAGNVWVMKKDDIMPIHKCSVRFSLPVSVLGLLSIAIVTSFLYLSQCEKCVASCSVEVEFSF